MKYNGLLKSFFLTAGLFVIGSCLYSQDCVVENVSLKGAYTGDCKKGKADGHGKAVGTDTYEGGFKSGLPDGEGTYTWSNGNVYKGKFEKGLKNGTGVMTYKRPSMADSVVEGFWKKDQYVGRYEKPYNISSKSRKVTNVNIEFKKDRTHQVVFSIFSTLGGAATISEGVIEKSTIDDIQLTRGGYTIITRNNNFPRKTETTLHDVSYPIHMKLSIGSEIVELELFEEGSYLIEIRING